MRLKFDLDLPSGLQDDLVLNEGVLHPEWDWKRQALLPDHCRVIEMLPRDAGECSLPARLRPTAKKLKNLFQRLTPARTWLRNQVDGQEFERTLLTADLTRSLSDYWDVAADGSLINVSPC